MTRQHLTPPAGVLVAIDVASLGALFPLTGLAVLTTIALDLGVQSLRAYQTT